MKLLLACLLAAAAVPLRAQDDVRWDARVAASSGDVVVHPAGGGDDSGAEADMPLEEGDRVTTGENSSADISLDGGSLIHLEPDSDFTLEKTERAQSSFLLAFGSLIAKIQKLGSQSLTVRTPGAVAAVRGTEFGVEAGADAQTHVGVFDEGRVEVKDDAGTAVLTPNQETTVEEGRAPMRPVALKRFVRFRTFMKAHRRRLAALRKRWRALPPAERRARREQFLQRMRRLRGQMAPKRRRLNQLRREKFEERRKANLERRRNARGERRRNP
ncbi:MAG: FecR domain-containing protein [Elusimicrobia bacterium]|nr:FecR domain-containing protein [Elusimicrobiota bacterium]